MQNLKVVVAHRPPFVFVTNSSSGTPFFSGLLIDLLNRILITSNVSYKYNISVSPTNAGGSLEKNGIWSGVVGELVSQRADVALFPLTRTAARLTAIDVTFSYYDAGLGLLIGDGQTGPGPLSVLAPFEMTLWVTLLCTIIAVALLFWALDVYGKWIRNRQFEALRASGVLSEKAIARARKEDGNPVLISFMAAAGAPERPGRNSWGVQVLYVVYCFFCLIVLSSYTANLTSYLAVRRAYVGISGLQDLVRDNAQVGVNPGGSTAAYFATSHDSLATQLQPNVRYCDTPTCVAWVRTGVVRAFVTDQPVQLYLSQQQPCDLAVVGDPFGPGNLVLGLQKGSPLLPLFNAAIQTFAEDGTLTSLRRAWFDGLSQCGNASSLDSSRLTVNQMLGAFVFLVMGVLVAFVTGTVENLKWCLARAYARSYTEGSSLHNGRSSSLLNTTTGNNNGAPEGIQARSSVLLLQASRLRAATWRRLSARLLGVTPPPPPPPPLAEMNRRNASPQPAPQPAPPAATAEPDGSPTALLRGASGYYRGSGGGGGADNAAAPPNLSRTFISTVYAAVNAAASLTTDSGADSGGDSGGGKIDASPSRDVVLVVPDGLGAGIDKFSGSSGASGIGGFAKVSGGGARGGGWGVFRKVAGSAVAGEEVGGGSPRARCKVGAGESLDELSPLPLPPPLLPVMASPARDDDDDDTSLHGAQGATGDGDRALPGQPARRPDSNYSGSGTVAAPVAPPPLLSLPATAAEPAGMASPMRSARISPLRETRSNSGAFRGEERQTPQQAQWIEAQQPVASPAAAAERAAMTAPAVPTRRPSSAILMTLPDATELTSFTHAGSSDGSEAGAGGR